MKRVFGIVIVASVLAGGVLAVCLVSRGPGGSPGTQGHLVATSGAAPATAGPVVCANASVLNGPSTAPAGAVTIAAGTNQSQATGQSNTTYWLAPGTHTLGTGQYNQFQPASGDVYEGAPGAVINGQNANDYAFVSTATNVTVEYLTIENFVAPQSEGVVNQNSAANWTIQDDTIENNPNGAGAMLGTDDVLTHNCLTKNGQYGFQSYSAAGPHTVTVTDNEISYNDTKNYTASTPGCGCTGGAKFWATTGATITGNYVHDNQSVGIWADTDNTGFNISDNYFADNYAEGIIYEISYNAQIVDNTFVGNAVGVGPTNPGFPEPAIYLSESGSDPRVAGAYGSSFNVTGQRLHEQLVRRRPVGERQPVLRIDGQHVDRLLHARHTGHVHDVVVRGQRPVVDADRQPGLLRQLSLEGAERQRLVEHVQLHTGRRRLRLHRLRRLWLQRALLGVRHICPVHRLGRPDTHQQPPEQPLH